MNIENIRYCLGFEKGHIGKIIPTSLYVLGQIFKETT